MAHTDLREPAKNELWIPLLYACFYFPVFSWLNTYMIPRFMVSCRLDELIPFCSWFVIPYVLWFGLVPWSLVYFHSRERKTFRELCFVLFVGMTFSLLCYWLFPNGLALRRSLPDHSIASDLVRMIRFNDAPVNVCPSIHVSSSIAIAVAVFKSPRMRRHRLMRGLVVALSLLICVSTLFIKQHSVVDVVCGTVLTAVLHHTLQVLEARRNAPGRKPPFSLRRLPGAARFGAWLREGSTI